MNVVRRLLLPPLLIALLSFAGAHAREFDLTPGEAWVLDRIALFSSNGQSLEKITDAMLSLFDSSDVTGGGVSRADVVTKDQVAQAHMRAKLIQDWLIFDMDGDGVVTRAETAIRQEAELKLRSAQRSLTDSVRTRIAESLGRTVAKIFKADTNEDGQITFHEMLAHGKTEAQAILTRHPTQAIVPLSLDQDGDGRVSKSEYIAVINRLLGETDSNSDGIVSQHESAEAKRKAKNVMFRLQREEDRRKLYSTLAADCAFPTPGKDAHIAFVFALGSRTLSNVKFVDRRVAMISTVHIEEGDQPLYLVLTSGPRLIWRFTGAVERIANVVALELRQKTESPLNGVIGLAKGKVHIPGRADCLKSIRLREDPYRPDGILKNLLGRLPDSVAMHNWMTSISLPSGVIEHAPEKPDAWPEPVLPGSAIVWQEAAFKHPGGIARIDAESIISAERVTQIEQLPGYAGLAQLVDQGILEVIRTKRVTRVGSVTIVAGTNDTIKTAPNGPQPKDVDVPVGFLIHKAMAFPEGSLDTSELRFLLAPGAPVPTNMDEDICLAEQQTGRLVNGNPEKCIF